MNTRFQDKAQINKAVRRLFSYLRIQKKLSAANVQFNKTVLVAATPQADEETKTKVIRRVKNSVATFL